MGTHLPYGKRGRSHLPNFSPISIVAKRLDGSTWHLAWRWALVQASLCYMGTQLLSQKKEAEPQLSAYFYCGQTVGCIKMPLGINAGLSPCDFVLDGDPAPSPKGAELPIFCPPLLWPNGCMDQDATSYGGRPRPMRLCVRCLPSYPEKKGHSHPTQFWPIVNCGQTARWMKTPLWYGSRPRPKKKIAIDGIPALRETGTAATFFPPMSMAAVTHLSYC